MSESIYTVENPELRASVPRGMPLIVALQGQNDAGSVVSQLTEYVHEQCNPEVIIEFVNDDLLDYRARRPVISFNGQRLEGYEPESLTLSLAYDQLEKPFLLLSGYEPDFRWDEFIDTVLLFIEEFAVTQTLWAHGIPMPVPHTRPVATTVSGSREDLIEARSSWRPSARLAASIAHVIEFRLHERDEEVVGLAILVPHYIASTEVPAALSSALDGIMAATGLIFATEDVNLADAKFQEQVESQIHGNDELREMVRTLEQRYDEYMEDQGAPSPLVAEDGTIPTADQIASELERFLAERQPPAPGESS